MEDEDYPPTDSEYDPEIPLERDTPEKWCLGDGCYQRKNHEPES